MDDAEKARYMAMGVSKAASTLAMAKGLQEIGSAGLEKLRGTRGKVSSTMPEMPDANCGTACNGEGVCFVGDTTVSTKAGEKRIDQIEVGELVWSSDPGGRPELHRVDRLFRHVATSLVVVTESTGDVVRVTPEHPFWVVGRGWVPAGELNTDDYLLELDNEIIRVRDVEHLDNRVEVFNLEVAGTHTYYAGSEQVLVHNTAN